MIFILFIYFFFFLCSTLWIVILLPLNTTSFVTVYLEHSRKDEHPLSTGGVSWASHPVLSYADSLAVSQPK